MSIRSFFPILLLLTFSISVFGGVGLYKHVDLSYSPVTACRMVVGDLDGDALVDYVFNDGRRLIKAFNHNGSLLWEKFNPNDPGDADSFHNFTISIYDIDLDGENEVICFLEIDGQHALSVVNGATGNIETYAVLPFDAPRDHEYFGMDNFYMQDHIAIANLRGLDTPQDILAMHASKLKIAAYNYINGSLQLQWYYITAHNGYSSGHWAFPYDIDDDGNDEVIAGTEVLNESGALQWAVDIYPFNPEHPDWGLDHVDAASCADIDPVHPGKEIIFVAATGVWMYTPDGTLMWHHPSKVIDPVNGYFAPGEGIQEVLIGNFRPDVNGLEAVIYSEDMYADYTVAIFDYHGNVLKWDSQVNGPRRWITCAMDWDGDRSVDEIYSRTGIFNGQFQKISDSIKWSYMQSSDVAEFPPVVCDVTGDQREEIIWYDTNELFIMYNTAPLVGEVKPSPWESLKYRLRVSNMNHCSPMYFDWTTIEDTPEEPPEEPDTIPPNSPQQLNSIEITTSSITLAWSPPQPASDGDIADCYCIYRNGALISTVTLTSFSDTGLNPNTGYNYAVYSMDEVPNSCITPAQAVYQTLALLTQIAPPTNFHSAYQTENSISLDWNASVSNGQGGKVISYRILKNGSHLTLTPEIHYLDHNLSVSTSYSYMIFAVDQFGNISPQAVAGSFSTIGLPQPNMIFRELNAAIMTSPPVRLSNGVKTMSIQVSTTSAVSQLPSSLILLESDGTKTQILLSGNVPGSQFTGTLVIDQSISHGEAQIQLQEQSLVDVDGNIGTSKIISGGTIFIDQQAPIRPKSLKIISAALF